MKVLILAAITATSWPSKFQCELDVDPIPPQTAPMFIATGEAGKNWLCEDQCHEEPEPPVEPEPPPPPPPVEPEPPIVIVPPATHTAKVTWVAPSKNTDGTPVSILNFMLNYQQVGQASWQQQWAGAEQRELFVPGLVIGKEYIFQLFVQGTGGVMSEPAEVRTVIQQGQ